MRPSTRSSVKIGIIAAPMIAIENSVGRTTSLADSATTWATLSGGGFSIARWR